MPRHQRIKSKTDIYHVMLRGINHQVIFEDEEDYNVFIKTLFKYKTISGYKLFAYCLMSNHLHLLIKTEIEESGVIFKRIAGSYVFWYNRKYSRTGHLFQDRYKSEAVENDRYFLSALRYIHRNPIEAGICNGIGEYRYSSYNEIAYGKPSLVDADYIYGIINKEEFIKFCEVENNDKCMDIDKETRLNDKEAIKIINMISGCSNVEEFQRLDNSKRDRYIKELKENGLSIRQISRITGISFAKIRK